MSRCARLKNDRRGAEPLPPPPPSLSIFRSIDYPSSSLISHTWKTIHAPLSLSLLNRTGFPFLAPSFSPGLHVPSFVGPARSCREDSLDSPGDYVSCYYSSLSEGTPALLFSLSLSASPSRFRDPPLVAPPRLGSPPPHQLSPHLSSRSSFCPRGGPAAVIDKIVGLVSVEWRIIGLSVKDDRVKG